MPEEPRLPTEYVAVHLKPINVKMLDVYSRILDAPFVLEDIPNERLIEDVLDSPSGTSMEIRLMASREKQKRAKYVRGLANFLRKWTEQTLSQFQIPNHINHTRVPIFVEHKIFSKDCDSWVNDALRKNCDFVFCIVDDTLEIVPKQNADKITIVKWNPSQPRPIWSLAVAQSFWKEIGKICIERGFVDSTKRNIFSDSVFEDAIKQGSIYYNEQGETYSNPNAKAFFMGAKMLAMDVK